MTPVTVKHRFAWRYALTSGAIALLATGACALAVGLASRNPARIDLTSTRQHSLSDRTLGIIRSLESAHEIIVAADLPSLSPAVWQRVQDVLDEFDRASTSVGVTIIDSSSPGGLADMRALLDRLATMYAAPLARHESALRDGVEAALALAQGASGLSDALLAAGEAIDSATLERQQIIDLAAVARLRASEFTRHAGSAQAALDARLADSTVPLIDDARAALTEPLAASANEFHTLASSLEAFAQSLRRQNKPGAPEIDLVVAQTRSLRDRAAQSGDALTRLPPLQLLPVARALAATNAVVVVSETAATAVRFESLVPEQAHVDEMGGATADVRFIGEELLTTALGALSRTDQPVVVLVHAGGERLLDASGEPVVRRGPFQARALIERLRLRGMLVLEWAVALDDESPTIARIEDIGSRPVVWAIIGSAAIGGESAANLPTLERAVRELVNAGEPVLLSTAPSAMPGLGETDGLVAPVAAFGIVVDSGRPLLRRVGRTDGATVAPAVLAILGSSEHPVGRAVSGLTTLLPWATPMTIEDADGASAWPVLTLAHSDLVWGESQWLEFWSMAQSQRDRLANPPKPTSERDSIAGPWIVAGAGERAHPGGEGSQRVVVVGGLGWFFDVYTSGATKIDGRTVQTAPGNMELLEASIHWLAGQDELVGASARSAEVARIAPLSPGQLTALRWALIGALPALVLATGVALRLWRG